MKQLILSLAPGRLAVCRLPEGTPPAEVLSGLGPGFWALVRTPAELSLVCLEESAPAAAAVETGWRALEVTGPLDFGLTGVLASLAAPLAESGVSIFAVSTFDTDYVLVRESALETALVALTRAGHRIR